MSARHRIAVWGSAGQLGTELVEVLRQNDHFDVIALSHADADCTDAQAVRRVFNETQPQVAINCAAFVRVDDCEERADEAFRVNAVGALNIAKHCAELGALCVYLSTDYVFDGAKRSAYVESDLTLPVNVYGASKLAGELLVRQAASRWLIVRTASLFGRRGARGKGGNFVETMIAKAKTGEALKVVNDITMSPTYARDAATGLAALLSAGCEGIVHLTNDGDCSWYEFARQVFVLTGETAALAPIPARDYPTRARRPANSALRSERSPIKLRSWQDGLRSYLIEMGYIEGSVSADAGSALQR